MGIVATFIGAPEVVILDEPFANLDPTTQIRLKGIIKDLAAKSGVTVMVSSHDLMHVTEVCERIVVLEKGQIVKDIVTAPATLKELEAYFSGAAAPSPIETVAVADSSALKTRRHKTIACLSATPRKINLGATYQNLAFLVLGL